jgi:long-chain acyl-CoA synthetase
VGLLEMCDRDPDAPAVDDGERRRSRSALIEGAGRVHALLADELGLDRGAHVALLSANRVEVIEWYLAAQLAGVWITPVSRHLTAEEIAYVVGDSGCQVLVTDGPHEETARTAAASVRVPPSVVVLGRAVDEHLASLTPRSPEPTARPGGSLFYTSGTTGRPKGVRRSPAPDLASAWAAAGRGGRALGLDGAGPHLVTGPLFHAAPLGFAMMDLHNGAELVIMDRFDAARTLALIDQRQVTATHLVPTMFVRLLGLPEPVRAGFDGSSLRTVLHGAAPVAPSVKHRMIDWWGSCITEYWGASEGGVVTLVGADDWLERPGTVGRPVAGHEVYVGDEQAEPLPPGSTGRLWCRNTRLAQVFTYHGDDEKTRTSHPRPGTYSLGDIGRVDEDGYVHLADRASNMVISGGVNIYPAEIEAVLGDHPAVADVAVFGVPDPEWGEAVKAAVELAEGWVWDSQLESAVIAHARERLAGYKVPRSFDVHDSLPRADTGKLAVRTLRDPYWADRDRAI